MRSWWIFTILTLIFVTTMVTLVIANPQDATIKLEGKKAEAGKAEIASVPDLDGPHPLIDFEEQIHDFGNQISGDELKHVFNFRNTGDADLVINRVKGG
jgi:Protein of unknown function (DUF1573)